MLGHDVSVRPRTTSASTSVQGPWQIDGDRLALLEEVAHERHGVLVRAQVVGVGDAAGQHQAVVVGGVTSPTARSAVNLSPLSRWLKAWISPVSGAISSASAPLP